MSDDPIELFKAAAPPDLFSGFSGTIQIDKLEPVGGENGDEPTALAGSGLFHVAGTAMPCHIHLVAVEDDDDFQRAVCSDEESYLDGLDHIDEGGAPRGTFHYKGLDYVIVLWPFGR